MRASGVFRRAMFLTCAVLFGATSAQSQTLAEFYAGKNVEFYVPAASGGGFDAYARAIAPYLRKYMPGQPTITIVNMPGAGGIGMLRRMYDVSPKDGTVLALLNRVALSLSKLDPSKVNLDLKRLEFVGSVASEIGACYSWTQTGVKSLDDVRKRKVIFADTSIGGIGYVYSSILARLANDNVTHVLGYLNSADAWLAMEKGEAEANCNGWFAVVVQKSDWIEQKKITPILQFGEKPLPGLENVPLIFDIPMSPDLRRAVSFLIRTDAVSRVILAPPGTQADRMEAWRIAFAKAVADPEFLAFAQRARLEVDPLDHVRVREIVEEILDTPPAALELARQIMQ